MIEDAVLIAGPTASGKSALALDIARREGRVVVNADSMQVYDGLRVLTARPSAADEAVAPHRLYGHVPSNRAYSVGAWIEDVRRLSASEGFGVRGPVFVGGTGLYFRALCQGLADIPAVPADTRRRWRERLGAVGSERLHQELRGVDPEGAAAIRPGDGQRIVRALEVREATGRTLGAWQATGARPVVDEASARMIVIEPDRADLRRRIDARFDAMVAAGALDEVRSLASLVLPADAPLTKAIGVRELGRALLGEISLAEAVAEAKTASRRYAKRQATWFRHQLGLGWTRLPGAGHNF